jgi:hypothetical protein
MRKMINQTTQEILSVYEHVMAVNFWEYYMLEDSESDLTVALVLGYEQEIGNVSKEEIKPFILSRTKDLTSVFPAVGYQWM